MPTIIRAAACHAAPVFLDAHESTLQAIALIRKAASNSANLVVFPKTFLPGYPAWNAVRKPTENHDLFTTYAKQSLYADGDEIKSIQATARELGVMVSLGFSEKVRYSCVTLFNSNVFIDANGRILNHHRKLVATFYEKLTWSHRDGHGLQVLDTLYGKIGSFICGENTNPLARYTLIAQGEQLHLSSYPPVWPTDVRNETQLELTSAKSGDEDAAAATRKVATKRKNYDNVAANRIRTAAHCFEAKCFGVLVSSMIDDDAISRVAEGAADAEFIRKFLKKAQRGATMFVDPTGDVVEAFTVDDKTNEHVPTNLLQNEEGILYADINLDDYIEKKQFHDVVGHYQRYDIFELKVNRTRHEPIHFTTSQSRGTETHSDNH